MRKFMTGLIAVILILLLGAGGYAAWSWYSLDDTPVPQVKVSGLSPDSVSWHVPVFFNLLERQFKEYVDNGYWEAGADGTVAPQLLLESDNWQPALPEGYQAEISVTAESEKEAQFRGSSDAFRSYVFPENGMYAVQITLTKLQADGQPYGTLNYSFPLKVDVPPPPPPNPVLLTSSDSVVQGDVLAVELQNVPEGQTPQGETGLGQCVFTAKNDGTWVAYIGIGDAHDTGAYTVTVRFDGFEQAAPVTVTSGTFGRQDLWIDTTQPSITEANSTEAYQQFRDTIYPFYETADSEIYWSGAFLQPVQGRISSEYGLLRYTNGGTKPRRHAGIDIAVAEGTPIQAPAAGRVVFSDYLLNTGNTLVIEHGGGIKTYYYHLVERNVKADELVEQGQLLGKVGTTGYSTGPHLHFEVRIGNQNLDPFKFFDGTGGCFVLE